MTTITGISTLTGVSSIIISATGGPPVAPA